MTIESESGIVYVLTNPAMPGLVKLGKTSRNSVDTRLGELYTTGVPVPFECAFAAKVTDVDRVEKAFHMAFQPYRPNTKREFFEIEPEQAIALLKLMAIEDVTPALQEEADNVDKAAKSGADRLKRRRPTQNFEEMNIPTGALLEFTRSEETCEVASARTVLYKNEEIALTPLTMRLLEIDYSIQPSPYWLYNGKLLSDIYEETYDAI